MPNSKLKVCSKCTRLLPIAAFSKRAASADGLQFKCKACCNEYMREEKEKFPEKIDARNRAYLSDPVKYAERQAWWKLYYAENAEHFKQRNREYYQAHKEEVNARTVANRKRRTAQAREI